MMHLLAYVSALLGGLFAVTAFGTFGHQKALTASISILARSDDNYTTAVLQRRQSPLSKRGKDKVQKHNGAQGQARQDRGSSPKAASQTSTSVGSPQTHQGGSFEALLRAAELASASSPGPSHVEAIGAAHSPARDAAQIAAARGSPNRDGHGEGRANTALPQTAPKPPLIVNRNLRSIKQSVGQIRVVTERAPRAPLSEGGRPLMGKEVAYSGYYPGQPRSDPGLRSKFYAPPRLLLAQGTTEIASGSGHLSVNHGIGNMEDLSTISKLPVAVTPANGAVQANAWNGHKTLAGLRLSPSPSGQGSVTSGGSHRVETRVRARDGKNLKLHITTTPHTAQEPILFQRGRPVDETITTVNTGPTKIHIAHHTTVDVQGEAVSIAETAAYQGSPEAGSESQTPRITTTRQSHIVHPPQTNQQLPADVPPHQPAQTLSLPHTQPAQAVHNESPPRKRLKGDSVSGPQRAQSPSD